MNKRTLKKPVTLSGIGLHTGKMINVTILPGDSSTGVKFKRIDVQPEVTIPADVGHVTLTDRSTTLSKDGVSVTTVEHLLSALAACEIDCAIIEVNGPEIPILDGSSKLYYEAFQEAGIDILDELIDEFVIDEMIEYRDDATGSQFIAIPAEKMEYSVIIDYPTANMVLQQSASISDFSTYGKEISSCRTFVFSNELEALLDKGLIKGGDLNNAIVLADKNLTQDKLDHLCTRLDLEKRAIPENGILNNESLLFPNELARHKLLDLIGDLSLVGKPIRGKIIAIKPGHKINTEFAAILKRKAIEQRKLKGKPHYDPDIEPVMDTEKIKAMLPHRYPFLMVDKIIEMSPNHVIGVKNVTINETFFLGHFPGNPVFPGVLQMEALAQTGGLLALSTVEEPHLWDTYFLKMDAVKFKAKVVPGDTLLLKMELLAPIRRGIVQMKGTAYVGHKLVSEGELTAQIIKRSE